MRNRDKILGQLLQQLYNIADAWVVGNFADNTAFAAISSSGSLTFLVVGVFNGIAIGGGVVISRYFGAGDRQKVRLCFHPNHGDLADDVYIYQPESGSARIPQCNRYFAWVWKMGEEIMQKNDQKDSKKDNKTRGKVPGYLRLMLLILIMAVVVLICFHAVRTYQKKQAKAQIQTEIANYQKQKNKDGIITRTDDPYFTKKQPGYRYRRAETITYPSAITNTNRHAMVFLPADYNPDQTYPVLYLLHGYGGSHRTWRNKKADIILQNLYYFEDVPEMIVVCPNSNVNEKESIKGFDFPDIIEPFDKTAREIKENLMPYINAHYPVKKGRANTAIAGNSMGGRNALAAAYTYPELFGYVGAFSSATAVAAANDTSYVSAPLRTLELPERIADFRVLMLMVGKSDHVCGNVTYELDQYMKKQKIPHIFYDTAGGHETVVWQNALYNFVKMCAAAYSGN